MISFKLKASKLSKLFYILPKYQFFYFLRAIFNCITCFSCWDKLTLACIILKNNQTYLKNLVVWTPQKCMYVWLFFNIIEERSGEKKVEKTKIDQLLSLFPLGLLNIRLFDLRPSSIKHFIQILRTNQISVWRSILRNILSFWSSTYKAKK